MSDCPFCEDRAFDMWTLRHIRKKPFGFKKILLTLEKNELEHLEKMAESSYEFDSVQHYLRILIQKDITRIHRIEYEEKRRKKISDVAESDI